MASAVSPSLAPQKKFSLPVLSLPWSKEFELLRSCCTEADVDALLAAADQACTALA